MFVKLSDMGDIVEFPYTIRQLRLDNPNTSFFKIPNNKILASFNIFPVVIENQPDYDSTTQEIKQNNLPEKNGDMWVLNWSIHNI